MLQAHMDILVQAPSDIFALLGDRFEPKVLIHKNLPVAVGGKMDI